MRWREAISIDRACGQPPSLLHDIQFHLRDAAADHAERSGCRIGDVDDASGNVGAAIVDPNRHGLPVGDIGHAQLCADGMSDCAAVNSSCRIFRRSRSASLGVRSWQCLARQSLSRLWVRAR